MIDKHDSIGDLRVLVVMLALVLLSKAASAAEGELPEAKPVPDVQVLPLPYDQASFQFQGNELTRYHFGPALKRPFLYPLMGPAGRSLTRMGHPHDPITHSHHNSVWISHNDVGGVSFWDDRPGPRIVCQRIEQYEDSPTSAWLLGVNAWQDADQKTLMTERRRVEVQRISSDYWLMLIDLQLEAPGPSPLVLGQTPFGMIGVRMAKTIGVHDGGGRILNSEDQRGEDQAFRKSARWVDYSGPVTNEATGGITLMDHPTNRTFPTPFHVRSDGWMGVSLTLNAPITIEPGRPLRLRYGLFIHAGVPQSDQINEHWLDFSRTPLPAM